MIKTIQTHKNHITTVSAILIDSGFMAGLVGIEVIRNISLIIATISVLIVILNAMRLIRFKRKGTKAEAGLQVAHA
jgi:Cd2+/Zn2+-exporting ATPase